MAGDPDALMAQMRQRLAVSPLAQKAAADPGFMRGVIAANPTLCGMLDGNPRLKQLLTSPDAIRGLLSGARQSLDFRHVFAWLAGLGPCSSCTSSLSNQRY
jgi:hypothetical protein